jgi:hypothetical protein
MNKKGVSLQQLAPFVILFVVTTIVLSIGADILGSVRDGQTALSYEYNITTEGLEGSEEIGSWLDTIGLVLGASAVIGIIYMFFMRGR